LWAYTIGWCAKISSICGVSRRCYDMAQIKQEMRHIAPLSEEELQELFRISPQIWDVLPASHAVD
jgi:hypothetical protein